MAEKRDWFDYVDLLSKVLLPIVILGATIAFSQQEDARKTTEEAKQQEISTIQTKADNTDRDRQSCINLEIQLVSISCEGKACDARPTRNGEVLTLAQLLHTMCSGVGLELSAPVRADVLQASAASHDVAASVAGQLAAGRAPPGVTIASATATPLLSPGLANAPAASPQTRVYIQYADKNQAAAASELQDRLNVANFHGRRLLAPPVQHVVAAPNQTELRCFKKADCAVASELASYVAGQIDAPVSVRDFSQRFETDPAVRPGNFELWFGPGAIQVGSSGGGGFS